MRRITMSIHQLKDWPNLYWNDEQLSRLLAEVRFFMQGKVLGGMEALDFHNPAKV